MLKKVVKYGNSNAIILDKAILELLNIAEGSMLKIKTDGTSLILTPVEPITSFKPSMTGEEYLMNVVHEGAKKLAEQAPKLDAQYSVDPVLSAQMQQEVNALRTKYAEDIDSFDAGNPEFYQELESLKEIYQQSNDRKGYMAAFLELRKKYFPRLAGWDAEMMALDERYSKKMSENNKK